MLEALWRDMDAAFTKWLAESGRPVEQFLKELNRRGTSSGECISISRTTRAMRKPFAFLVTYTHQLSAHGRAQHLPLGDALREYAGVT